MAVRKETIKQQFGQALPALLEPGEQVQAGAYCISGPNPLWSQGLLGLVGYLIFGIRHYYLAATDRRVIFMKASIWTSRPKGLAFADPRGSVSISDVRTDAKLWNSCRFTGPNQQDLRLNFHVFWRDETREVAGALADRISGTITPRADAPPLPQEIAEKLEAQPQIDLQPPPPMPPAAPGTPPAPPPPSSPPA